MNLNVLLRGQSNAEILGQLTTDSVVARIQSLLGFDGVTDTVTLQFASRQPTGNTVNSGTGLINDWLVPGPNGTWTPTALENGLLSFIRTDMTAQERADPTVVLWLHNEFDSANAALTPELWTSAVRADAALVRAEFGSAVPYVFVAPIPYGSGTDAGHQAIRLGMEQLAADPGFNAIIGARANDLDMDRVFDGAGGHMSAADAALVAARAAASIAEAWAAYAKPNSPVALANGAIADDGPRARTASVTGPREVSVDLGFDVANALGALDADALAGTGWTLRTAGGASLQATGLRQVDADTLALTFGADVPAGATLHYGYGIGDLGGQGNGIYDSAGLPLFVPAAGLVLGAGPAVPGQLLKGDALDNNLTAGAGGDTIEGGAGNDYMIGGAGADVFEFGARDNEDWIEGFTAGVDRLRFATGVLSTDVLVQNMTVLGVAGLGVVLAPGHSIFLAGVAALQAGDLVFAPPPPPAGQYVFGTAGDDQFEAGRNGDTLVGGEGNDYMLSGPGRDTFVLLPEHGQDWINGFASGLDKLHLTGGLSAADVRIETHTLQGISGQAVFTAPGIDHFVFLANVASLQEGDIVYGSGQTRPGTPGADAFVAGPGDNRFDGAGGSDSVSFAGPLSTYDLVRHNGTLTVHGLEGTTVLTGIETLRFGAISLTVTDDLMVDFFDYARLNPDVAAAGIDARTHYDNWGWREGRDPNARFDTDAYLAANPDVAAAGVNPLAHYNASGWKEGRDPSARFDTSLYLARNPDVAQAGMNPLLHFLSSGEAEGRKAMPVVGAVDASGFDATWYRISNPDVARAGVDPAAHYQSSGWSEGRDPNAYFDTSYYLATNPDVAAAGMNPLAHYMAYGYAEASRNPSAAFGNAAYMEANPDVAAAGMNPLLHWLAFGIQEGRAGVGDVLIG